MKGRGMNGIELQRNLSLFSFPEDSLFYCRTFAYFLSNYVWQLSMVLISNRTNIPLNFSCCLLSAWVNRNSSVQFSLWFVDRKLKECADCYLPDQYRVNTSDHLPDTVWWTDPEPPSLHRFSRLRQFYVCVTESQRPCETSARLFTVQSMPFCQSELHCVCPRRHSQRVGSEQSPI